MIPNGSETRDLSSLHGLVAFFDVLQASKGISDAYTKLRIYNPPFYKLKHLIMGTTYTRQELYEMVWERPLTAIAKEIGVSDSALGKACRKAGVTRPDQGHWAKLKAGKPTQKRPLAYRFPGATNSVHIGGNRYHYQYARYNDLDEPIGPPPTFDEDIDDLLTRIKKMVGKVAYPTLSSGAHPIIRKLLEHDEERRESSWQEPYYDSAIDKRRLRLLNAIFLYCHQIGCTPYMSTSKYDDKEQDASIRVGEQRVSVVLVTSSLSI